ncbi:MAG: hypothetical protein PHE29_04390 [Tissierellia bacterium]|nr:hypothetical protein [Tissierellia bacterium]MDD4780761.1 hypothetical protein [Tissierellia bacterium]
MENAISMVRTTAPLTSEKTISKINTYLPPIELMSTLFGMYSFLNKAQNFTPIKPLKGKTPMEKVSALIANGNLPVGKMITQPLIANNMDKIMSSFAKGVIGNGNINDLISSMASQYSNKQGSSNNNTDLSSLMETFMPLINNIMSSQSSNDNNSNNNDDNYKNIEIKEKNEDLTNDVTEFEENKIINENINDSIPETNNTKIAQPKNTPIRIRQRRKDQRHNQRTI